MIHDIFKYLSEKLNEHLQKIYQLPEELVEVISFGQELGTDFQNIENKSPVWSISMEKEDNILMIY